MSDTTLPVEPLPVKIIEVGSTDQKREFLYAFAKAQGGFQPIEKNRSVTIRPREGAPYHFKFADMQEIHAKTRPALAANGLSTSFLQDHDGEGVWLVLLLGHAEGFERKSVVFCKYGADIKQFGGLLSYQRRYMLQAMLDVAADDDLDDAETGEGKDAAPPPPARPASPARKSAPARVSAAPVMPPEPPPEDELSAEKPVASQNSEPEPEPADVRAEPRTAAPADEETGELVTDGERQFALKRCKTRGNNMQQVLHCLGFLAVNPDTLSSLTKVQFTRLIKEL